LGLCDVEILGFDGIAIDFNYSPLTINTFHPYTVSNKLEAIQAEFILLFNHGIGYAGMSSHMDGAGINLEVSPCASCSHDADPDPEILTAHQIFLLD
jgi:hypothetical protein